MSKQHVLGPAERAKTRAMQVTVCEIEAQRRAIKSRNARQRADHLEKGCGKPLRSRTTLGKAKAAK
jgi:hypothetical protein